MLFIFVVVSSKDLETLTNTYKICKLVKKVPSLIPVFFFFFCDHFPLYHLRGILCLFLLHQKHPVYHSSFLPLYLTLCAKLLRLCLTPCDPMDSSPPGSSVHEILQARILECVAISFSRGFLLTQGSNPCLLRLLYWQVGSLPLMPPEKPHLTL